MNLKLLEALFKVLDKNMPVWESRAVHKAPNSDYLDTVQRWRELGYKVVSEEDLLVCMSGPDDDRIKILANPQTPAHETFVFSQPTSLSTAEQALKRDAQFEPIHWLTSNTELAVFVTFKHRTTGAHFMLVWRQRPIFPDLFT